MSNFLPTSEFPVFSVEELAELQALANEVAATQGQGTGFDQSMKAGPGTTVYHY
jgi:hypothetical protein